MLFMVIERFRDNDMLPIYQRLRDQGRSIPEGLEYIELGRAEFLALFPAYAL